MKRIAIALFAVVVGVGAMVQDAEAKRLGGGTVSYTHLTLPTNREV